MKKYIFIAASILVILGSLLYFDFFGDVSETEYSISESKLFSEDEIQEAMKVAKRYFTLNYGGCQLERLYYDESSCYENISNLEEWKENYEPTYDVDAVIILYADITIKNKMMAEKRTDFVDCTEGNEFKGDKWILFLNESDHWVLHTISN